MVKSNVKIRDKQSKVLLSLIFILSTIIFVGLILFISNNAFNAQTFDKEKISFYYPQQSIVYNTSESKYVNPDETINPADNPNNLSVFQVYDRSGALLTENGGNIIDATQIKLEYFIVGYEGTRYTHVEWKDKINANYAYSVISKLPLGEYTVKCVVTLLKSEDSFSDSEDVKTIEVAQDIQVLMKTEDAFYLVGPTSIPQYINNDWKYALERLPLVNASGEKGAEFATYYSGRKLNIQLLYTPLYFKLKYTDQTHFENKTTDAAYEIPKDSSDLTHYNEVVGLEEKFGKQIYMRQGDSTALDGAAKYYFVNNKEINNELLSLKNAAVGTNSLGKINAPLAKGFFASNGLNIKITVETRPIMLMFSNYATQVKYLDVNDKLIAGTTYDVYAGVSDIVTDLGLAPSIETDIQAYRFLHVLDAKDVDGKWKVSLDIRRYMFLYVEDGKFGKVYDREDFDFPTLLSPEKAILKGNIKEKSKYDESGVAADNIEVNKLVNAGEYVFDITLDKSDIFVLTFEKMNSTDKVIGDGISTVDNPGKQIRFKYTIKKAKLPTFNLISQSDMYYNGEPKPVTTDVAFVNENIQYKASYTAIEGLISASEAETVNKLGPKNVGYYYVQYTITDPNYDTSDKTLSERTTYIRVLPILFTAQNGGVDMVKPDKAADPKAKKYTLLSITLPHGVSFVPGGTEYVSIDGGQSSNTGENLKNLKIGKHTCTIYSTSSNYLLSKKDGVMVSDSVTFEFSVPDFREVPLLGGFLGTMFPALGHYTTMALFLFFVLCLIVAIAVILRGIVLTRRVKKNKKKVKRVKKHDLYYQDKIDAKNQKKQEKKEAKLAKKAAK